MPGKQPQTAESAQPLQWVNIADFTPGIIQNSDFAYGTTPIGAVPAQKPGTAQYATTNCIALPNGGLAPLPGLKESFDFGQVGIVTGALAYGQVGSGAQPNGPEYANGGDEILTAVEDVAGITRSWAVTAYQESTADPFNIAFASGTSSQSAVWATSMVLTQLNPLNTSGNVGSPSTRVAISHHFMRDSGGDIDTIVMYPYYKSPHSAPYTQDISASNQIAGPLIAHNNRILMLQPLPTPWAAPPGHALEVAFYTAEAFDFTDPPGTFPFPPAQLEQFVVEQPFQHGAWGSISNGELMLIRHQGGGYIISGDVINPSITRLFAVTPTQGYCQLAGQTTIGLVYASQNNGVWVWSGGSASTKISQQLNDDAVQIPQPANFSTYGPMCSFAQLGDLIYCPNGWVFSTTVNSWWRWTSGELASPAAWHFPTFDGQGMWVWPTEVVSNLPTVIKLSRFTPAKSYTWKSYPMPFSTNTLVTVGEVVVRAQGVGTITIAFNNPNGESAASLPVTFPVSSDIEPTVQRMKCAATGTDITMTITSTGPASAPVIYDVSIGYYMGNPVNQT
jgi:hypothetical protein